MSSVHLSNICFVFIFIFGYIWHKFYIVLPWYVFFNTGNSIFLHCMNFIINSNIQWEKYSLKSYLSMSRLYIQFNVFVIFSLQNLVFIIVGMGIVFSIAFHLIVREPVQHEDVSAAESAISDGFSTTIEKSTVLRTRMTWKCWLKTMQFYQVHMYMYM